MNLNYYIAKNTPAIHLRIKEHISAARSSHSSQIGVESLSLIEESAVSGKMLRGNLFLLVAQIFGAKELDNLYDIAAGIEILQTGLLIHDDIMDHDLKRRNNDSVFASYIKKARNYKAQDPEHYGTSMAICAGDLAYFLVFDIFAKSKIEPKKLILMINKLAQELQGVGVGQMMDVAFGQLKKNPTKEEIENVNLLKTARYTFLLPMVLGSLSQTGEAIEILEKLGLSIGAIFQLRDDELGLFGNDKVIGKEIGSDIRENKKTLIRKILFDKSNEEERKLLSKIFGKKDLTLQEIDIIKQIVIKNKVQEAILEVILTHKSKSKDLISELNSMGYKTGLLSEMLDFVSQRDK
jgi:geranylgeranyl diphosphate synthase type I